MCLKGVWVDFRGIPYFKKLLSKETLTSDSHGMVDSMVDKPEVYRAYTHQCIKKILKIPE